MLHEAVSTEVNATVPEGQVLRVTRRGFRLRERLLRAASVIVAAPAAEADATTATDAVN
jgi:molecular chaperone GrpE